MEWEEIFANDISDKELVSKIYKEHIKLNTQKRNNPVKGHLGGSVGWASNFGSGHHLPVCEFEPCIRLCADSSEPGACFEFCVSLSLCSSPTHALSFSFKNKFKKHLKKDLYVILIFPSLIIHSYSGATGQR